MKVRYDREGDTLDMLLEDRQYMRLKYYPEELLERKVDLVIKNAVKSRSRGRIFSEVEYV